MHLLRAQAGAIADGSEPVDLGQDAAELVVLSAADTEIASLAAANARANGSTPGRLPSLRLANLMQLSHNLSVDLYVEQVVAKARLVVVRLLGGVSYWPYGVEQLVWACEAHGVKLAILPGDDQPDAALDAHSNLPREACHRLWQYCVQGGPENAANFLAYAAALLGYESEWGEPLPLPRAGLYWPGVDRPSIDRVRSNWESGLPVAALVFYRALVQASNLTPVDGLIKALQESGLNPLPIYVASLKEPVSAEIVAALLEESPAEVVLNATGFAVSSPGQLRKSTPFDRLDCPVLQVVFSGGNEAAWRQGMQGLSARDIAMNVALPEVDGRILSRAVSFKSEARFDAASQCPVVNYKPVEDRLAFVAELASAWARLRRTPANERKLAIVWANYPNRDGRIGNGVGLDTPAGTFTLLEALRATGYDTGILPANGQALVERLLSGPTNDRSRGHRNGGETLALSDYQAWFTTLSKAVSGQVSERWGPPDNDPFFDKAESAFRLPAFRLGKVVIGLQPARGYNIDPVKSYHDPDLVPPHGYLAFYAWLNHAAGVHAVIHMGKHGNLEWLPGKALALSEECFPDAVFGPRPHLYPFIVNDPGEGTQAKRRAQAVIVDHLTPPLTRAESYGPLAELEALVDEYFEAAGVDPRRLTLLQKEILDLSARLGLDKDCGIDPEEEAEAALGKLDNHLCELKEMQIRDGLHIFGRAPEGDQLVDLLVALTRLPRGEGEGENASLIRALAKDLGLGAFDPLDADLGATWCGPRPQALATAGVWRNQGDAVERLEGLAQALVSGERVADDGWNESRTVLAMIRETLRPCVTASGQAEIDGLLAGLEGRFIEPGPSGAPTRGRLDVLPTGRNFYSVDSRTVPTPAAWQLGWKSAGLLIERYRQEHGAWPERLALSAWGTANMRTGGDDIAQALALLGVRPRWETASRRVVDFEVMPLSVLDRPRVDVTLRVSGFFRDAFPAQIDLFDSAVRTVAQLDEPARDNPLAARVNREIAQLCGAGLDEADAQRQAGFRVFGAKPGAYGAGLQALIDERGWQSDADLARAYLAWGGYAYGAGAQGKPAQALFETRLKGVQAVIHNQDNREHDLLDSDDYYQFEGGMTAAVRHLSGNQPSVYHNDHSRPESPKIRRLEEEIARVVRARVVNPKWIEGVMRHGYKGAFEMAATVDYLFAFAATAKAVSDHHFDAVYEAYIDDPAVRDFLGAANPAALREMAERLLEAQDRGLWKPRMNSAYGHLTRLVERQKGRVT